MAGTIVADTLTHSTAGSLTTDYVVNGSAKAWAKINVTSGVPSASGSLNVSSITDQATGQMYINYSNVVANNNSSCTTAIEDFAFDHASPRTGLSTSYYELRTVNSSNVAADVQTNTHVMSQINGDLA